MEIHTRLALSTDQKLAKGAWLAGHTEWQGQSWGDGGIRPHSTGLTFITEMDYLSKERAEASAKADLPSCWALCKHTRRGGLCSKTFIV